jgi:hypothetical protein
VALGGVAGAAVHRRPLVPDQQIADLPGMAIGERSCVASAASSSINRQASVRRPAMDAFNLPVAPYLHNSRPGMWQITNSRENDTTEPHDYGSQFDWLFAEASASPLVGSTDRAASSRPHAR